MGSGTTAAALGAVALGAFRALRRTGAELEEAAAAIHRTMREIAVDGAFINVILGRWNGLTSTFRWIAGADQTPLLVTGDGEVEALASTPQVAMGIGEERRRFQVDSRRLQPGERLLLLSDGVLDRKTTDGGSFGMDGVRKALVDVSDGAAASTVHALAMAVTAWSLDPLEDDATIVVFAPTAAQQ